MSIRQFIIKSTIAITLFSLLFFLAALSFKLHRDTQRMEALMRFTGQEANTIIEHLVHDIRSRIELIRENLLQNRNPINAESGLFYIVDRDGTVSYISDAKLEELTGIKLSPKLLREGVSYSFLQDTTVVRFTSDLKGKRELIYEERFDQKNPIKQFIDRFVKDLPWNFTIMIVNSEGNIIHFKGKWTTLVGGNLYLIGKFKSDPITRLKTLEIGDSSYLFTSTTIAPLDWKLFMLYPLSSHKRILLQEAGILGLSLGVFITAFLAFFLYAIKQLERDVATITSSLKSGGIKEIKPEQIRFNELFRIGSELIETQKKLYKFKLFLEAMLRLANKAIIFVDRNLSVFIASSAATQMFETSDLEEVIKQKEWLKKSIQRALSTQKEVHEEGLKVVLNGKDEGVINLSVYPFKTEEISGCIVEIEDITEKVKLHEQLMIAQKMESLGILAGGIAHDFNNIINVILGYAQIIKGELKEKGCERIREHVETIEKQSARASDLIKQLLDFARASPSEKKVVDLKGIVKEYVKLISRVFPSNIEVLYEDSGEKSYCIKADISKLHQVLMNLAINAKDAMPNGGKLIFRLKKERGTKENLVILEVEDTGCGIPPEILEKIFDPFFTTKKTKGTGLGLSQVYGIMKEHRGSVKVKSRVGRGSTFILLFPEEPCHTQEKAETRERSTQRAKVLVIDNDEDSSQLIEKHLQPRGADIVKVNSLKEALEIVSSGEQRFHIVFIDLLLPNGDVLSLGERIKRMLPETTIIFMSDKADRLARIRELSVMGRIRTLSKPLNPQELEKIYLEVVKGSSSHGR